MTTLTVNTYTKNQSASDYSPVINSFTKLGSYYYLAWYDAGNTYVSRMTDAKGTGDTLMLTIAGYDACPHLVNIDDTLYLAAGNSGIPNSTTKIYTSTDGTTWNLDRTLATALGAIWGYDIFKLGATIWCMASFTTTVHFYDFGGAADYDCASDIGTDVTKGSVVGSNFYFIHEHDRWVFAGAADATLETTDYIIWAADSIATGKYYIYGKIEICYAYQYSYYWDRQLATWKLIDGSATGSYGGMVWDAWNHATHIFFQKTLFEILPGGGLYQCYQLTDQNYEGVCGWAPYTRIIGADTHFYQILITTATIYPTSGTLALSRAQANHNMTEGTHDWHLNDFVTIKADAVVLWKGYVSRVRQDMIEFKNILDNDLQFQKAHTFTAQETHEMISTIIEDDCNVLYEGTISTTPSTDYTITATETVDKHIEHCEKLEGYIAYWDIQGAVYFNNGTVDSTKSYTFGDQKLVKCLIGYEDYAISRAIIRNATTTVVRQKANAYCGQTAYDYEPSLTTAQCQTKADNLIAKNSAPVMLIEGWLKGEGILQWGTTLSVAWSPESLAATTFYILKVEWDYATNLCHFWASDVLIYNLFDDELKTKIESVAAPLIASATDLKAPLASAGVAHYYVPLDGNDEAHWEYVGSCNTNGATLVLDFVAGTSTETNVTQTSEDWAQKAAAGAIGIHFNLLMAVDAVNAGTFIMIRKNGNTSTRTGFRAYNAAVNGYQIEYPVIISCDSNGAVKFTFTIAAAATIIFYVKLMGYYI